jgi:hypothetical protein
MVSAWLVLAALSAVVSAVPGSTDTVWSTPSKPHPFVLAPLITPNVAQERITADTYVVLLKNSISESQAARHINEVASNKFKDPLLAACAMSTIHPASRAMPASLRLPPSNSSDLNQKLS